MRAYQEGQGRRKQSVLGIDVSQYAGYRVPGLDSTKMFSDPACMLKNPKPGAMYVWRKPDDPYTKSMCARGVLRPVTLEDIDKSSPYANIDAVKILTSVGPRQVVRSPGGSGLFEVQNAEALSDQDAAALPGKQWEHKYLSDLAEQEDTINSDFESLSASGTARVQGGISTKDSQREQVVS